jgi:hypothetical protein
MAKASTAWKRKYNEGAYRRYEFSIGLDKKLNYCLENFKAKGGNVSELVKAKLAEHFGVDVNENFYPFKFDKNGNMIQVEFLE